MRAFIAGLSLLALLGAANAQDLKRIDIIEYGTYATKVDRTEASPGSPTGTTHFVSNIRHLESTTTVSARVGENFGIRYRLVGRNGASVRLKKVWIIPGSGIRNPETGNTTTMSVEYLDRKVGTESFTSYSLDNSWEVVPGIWTLELWDGDRKMTSQGFLIKKQQ